MGEMKAPAAAVMAAILTGAMVALAAMILLSDGSSSSSVSLVAKDAAKNKAAQVKVPEKGRGAELPGVHLLASAIHIIEHGADKKASHHEDMKVEKNQQISLKSAVHADQATAEDLKKLHEVFDKINLPRAIRVDSEFSNLPRYGSHAWRIALDKAMLKQASLKLKVAKAQEKRDMVDQQLHKIDAGPLEGLKQEKHLLSTVEQNDKARAKFLEEKARQLSDDVVKDLNVEKGKFDIVQWYKSKSARESTSQSTNAVTRAENMWKKAALDSNKLMKLEGRSDYRRLSHKEASTEVRLNIYRANVDRLKAKLRKISARIHALQTEKSQQQHSQALDVPKTATEVKSSNAKYQASSKAADKHKATDASKQAHLRNKLEAVVGSSLADEGGSPARFEELASSDAAVRKAERKFHTSTPLKVADMVYDASRKRQVDPKVPMLEQKSIFNW